MVYEVISSVCAGVILFENFGTSLKLGETSLIFSPRLIIITRFFLMAFFEHEYALELLFIEAGQKLSLINLILVIIGDVN